MGIIVEVPVLVTANEKMQMTKVEVEDPRPGEVRVKMYASGVCHSCLHAYDGSHTTPMPIILGDEGSGVVESVGSGVTTLQSGDHVIISWLLNCGTCPNCRNGKPAHCWAPSPFGGLLDNTQRFKDVATGEPILHYGPATYAPYIVVPESSAIKIRKDMPLDKAALIGCSVTTGFGAVTNAAQARPGESVVVVGCGGVGLNSIQGARVVGAYPIIAVDTSDAALEMAKKLGATHTVNAAKEDVVTAVRKIAPRGVQYSIAAVGSTKAMLDALYILGAGGTMVILGAPPSGAMLEIDPIFILDKERRMIGSKYGSSNPHIEFPKLIELYLAGKLDLDSLLTGHYSLDEADKAFEVLAKGGPGRGLITFN
ncbi:MAG TPA: zinc-binding dehydrogenase [archaeon]|jgi:S-(hydroxymethyl)glutathione dehydrogenase/alcohol dehydrogenase|nr:zinc-binding dehydrogenase [archaeon]